MTKTSEEIDIIMQEEVKRIIADIKKQKADGSWYKGKIYNPYNYDMNEAAANTDFWGNK